MFFLLRAALIIGVIFYFSPVRHEGGSATGLDAAAGWSRDPSRAALDAAGHAGELQSLWEALPDDAKKAALDRLLASAPDHPSGEPPSATDTLLPDDLKPAWRGGRAGASRQP
jgi:hypothetical protein